MFQTLGASDLAGLQATGANVDLLLFAINDTGQTLDVRTEFTIGGAVRVADRTPGNSVLSANLTNLRHGLNLHLGGVSNAR